VWLAIIHTITKTRLREKCKFGVFSSLFENITFFHKTVFRMKTIVFSGFS